MGNIAQITKSTGKDVSGKVILAEFTSATNKSQQDSGGANNTILGTRFVSRVVNIAGPNIGYSIIDVPMRDFGAGAWDETAPIVALLKDGLGKVKPRARASVFYKESTGKVVLQNGFVVKIPHMIGIDGGGIVIFDDKWQLTKITSFGRMCYDPVRGVQYFDAGAACIFNEGGYGDCIDTDLGPRFAPSRRFGYLAQYDAEDKLEPDPGKATVRSRKWRVDDCLRYMRDIHYTGFGNWRIDYGNRTVDADWLIWPDTLISSINALRSVNSLNCENVTLLEALCRIIRKAGAFDLIVIPGADFKSTLGAANMNPSDQEGTKLRLPAYEGATDIGAMLADPEMIISGAIDESIVDYFDDVCICGDPVAMETGASTVAGNQNLVLEPAWSTSEETAFKAYITTNGNSLVAFKAACNTWPHVFASYRIKQGEPIWRDTKWHTMDANLAPYPRLRAYLLSSYSDRQTGSNPRDVIPRDVVIEYYDGAAWQPAERYNFFELSKDGFYFSLRGLRDKEGTPHTWKQSGSASLYTGSSMVKREIRLTIPMESDWRITGRAGLADSEGSPDDPNQTAERLDASEKNYTYLAVAEALDYVEYLRKGAHPNGVGGVGGVSATVDSFEDACTEGQELFSDRINEGKGRIVDHAKARLSDVKRILYGGQIVLATFNPAIRPGDPISIAGADGNLRCPSVVKTVTHDAALQGTILEAGARDASTIYDIPRGAKGISKPNATTQTSASVKPSAPPVLESEGDERVYQVE